MKRLDEAARGLSPEDVIGQEVEAIDRAFGGGQIPQDGARGGRDLRLHVGGDVGSTAGARLLAEAARRWHLRGGGTVWTTTHLWRVIPRSGWGERISVLASVERPEEIEQARRRGYGAIVVVKDFPQGAKAYRLPGSRTRIIPCPAQTLEGMTCIRCRLCLDRDLLRMGAAVALRTHGPGVTAANEALRSQSTGCTTTTASSTL
ncbi:MAG: hypothetical protein JXB32_10920 [Deltaproteobacteria bacterium]|nr:hypothetical protein [Deltaproteobacteria bacterium]